jgi:tetratricopeptide (TPR) repeat protein
MAEVQLATLAAEAQAAIDSDDFARAADACRLVLLRFPRWVEGYWLLGHILVENGYVPQARSCFEAVASAIPDDPRAYEGLAAAAEQQQDPATAVAGMVRAVEVGETSQGVLDELHRLQQQAGYVVDDAFTTARVAHARLIAGQYEEADVAAERALQQEPDRLDLLVVQAVARLFGGDRRGSQNVCQHLLDLSPDCLKALAILRFLLPREEAAPLVEDLSALDPEGKTLVWLRGQMTTLGYDADDLPAAPLLVRWEDGSAAGTAQSREIRPLDRLIPELEEVWPQWLKEAAQAAPEAPSDLVATPPPALSGAPPAPAASPSFLGDVDVLAREFEDAMRPGPPGAEQDVAPPPPEGPTSPTTPEDERRAVPVEWQAPEPAVASGQSVEAMVGGEEPAPSRPAATGAGDDFAQWRTAAPAGSAVDSAAPGHEDGAAPLPDEQPPVGEDRQGDERAAVVGGTESVQSLCTAARAAACAGDHWQAIDRYGAALALLRGYGWQRIEEYSRE